MNFCLSFCKLISDFNKFNFLHPFMFSRIEPDLSIFIVEQRTLYTFNLDELVTARMATEVLNIESHFTIKPRNFKCKNFTWSHWMTDLKSFKFCFFIFIFMTLLFFSNLLLDCRNRWCPRPTQRWRQEVFLREHRCFPNPVCKVSFQNQCRQQGLSKCVEAQLCNRGLWNNFHLAYDIY